MKVKLNLSGEGIKQFFLVNGEKIALGVVVIALIGFLYSAITAKPLDETKSPNVITRESAELMRRIQDPSSTPPPSEHKIDLSKSESGAISSMKWPVEISPLLFPELKKRTDPTILPIEEVQIASGAAIVGYAPPLASGATGVISPAPTGGALAVGSDHGPAGGVGFGAGAGGGKGGAATQTENRFNPQGMMGAAKLGDEPRAKTYAIITGLVPWSKQCEEYSNRFEFAVPPSLPTSDPTQPTPASSLQTGQPQLPEYIYFRVQRTEALQPKETDWTTTINYGAALRDVAGWSNQSGVQDIVDQNYIFQPATVKMKGQDFTTYITWPLPPLFLKIWGFEATHPRVKLNVPLDVNNPQPPQPIDLAQSDFDGTQGAVRAAAPPAARPMGGGFGQSIPNMARDHDAPSGRFGSGGFYGQPAPAVTPDNTVVVDNKLFRFIDLTAELGKTYRYRIQLVVNNPNYHLQPDCLLDAKTADVATLSSDWAVTGPVTIPRDYRLLADSVSVIGKNEPKAKLTVLAIVKAKPATEGVSTPLTGDVPLEALTELVKENQVIPMGSIVDLRDLVFDNVVDVPEGGLYRKVEKVSIDTEQTMLLDLRNDDALGSNPKSKGPTEMLFMDASGRLTTADSAADSLVVADYRERTRVPLDQNLQPAPEPVPTPRGPRGGPASKGPGYTPADRSGKGGDHK